MDYHFKARLPTSETDAEGTVVIWPRLEIEQNLRKMIYDQMAEIPASQVVFLPFNDTDPDVLELHGVVTV